MMLKELREKVYEANMDLPKHGLVVFTWGNASELDPETGLFVIKPSGVDYDRLTPENLVVCDLDGQGRGGRPQPLLGHAHPRRALPRVGREGPWRGPHPLLLGRVLGAGGRDVPAYGTTHADYFYGSIPACAGSPRTRSSAPTSLRRATSSWPASRRRGIDPVAVPACLVRNHGPFSWARTRRRPSTMPWCSRRSARWPRAPRRSITTWSPPRSTCRTSTTCARRPASASGRRCGWPCRP